MSRPESEAEYLARMVPPSVAGLSGISRRSLFKTALGVTAAVGLPSVLAGCGGGGDSGGGAGGGASGGASGGGSVGGTVTWGTNEIGTTFAKQRQAASPTSRPRTPALTVKLNEVDHNTFQENINNYLQGNPDDVFTWFAGLPACSSSPAAGLIGDVSDVWPLEGVADSFKAASTGEDGKQYFVPQSYYPWAIFYRKSLFAERGYDGPEDASTSWSTLAEQDEGRRAGAVRVRRQGRLAGDGHVRHPQHARQRLPVPHRPDGRQEVVGERRGQEGLRHLARAAALPPARRARPHLAGGGAGAAAEEVRHVPARHVPHRPVPAERPRGHRPVQLPGDRPGHRRRRHRRADRRLLHGRRTRRTRPAPRSSSRTWPAPTRWPRRPAATGEPFIASTPTPTRRSTRRCRRSRPNWSARPKNIAQFLDRDTRPDFASTVVIPAFQDFIKTPDDIDGLTKSLEEQKKTIFVE